MPRKSTAPGAKALSAIAETCLASRVRLASRAVTGLYDEALRPLNVRCSQIAVLVAIGCMGTARPSEIGRELGMDKSTLSRTVDRMVKNGWVRDTSGPGGARDLELTAEGRRLLERAKPAWRRSQKKMRALLGERDADTLIRIAEKLRAYNVHDS